MSEVGSRRRSRTAVSLFFLFALLVGMGFPAVTAAAGQETGDAVQRDIERKFDAPKAQLAKLMAHAAWNGLREEWRESPGRVVAAYLLLFVMVPLFLALDFARGSGRRKLWWAGVAVVVSWLVVPLIGVASRRASAVDTRRLDVGRSMNRRA